MPRARFTNAASSRDGIYAISLMKEDHRLEKPRAIWRLLLLLAPRTLRGWTLFPTFAKANPAWRAPADGNTGA